MTPSAINAQLLLPLRPGEVAVGGLIWYPLPQQRSRRQEINTLLDQEQGAFFVPHAAAGQLQCGLAGALPKGRSYYSIALLLLEQLGEEWAAIFALPDGRYLLLGVAKGAVVPGCDVILASAPEALERLESYRGLFNWQTIYAPEDLALGGQEVDLYQLLKSLQPKAEQRLRPYGHLARNPKLILLLLICASVLVALGSAGWNYYCEQQLLRQQREAALLRARKQAAEQQYKEHPKEQPQETPPWQQHPPASDLLMQCSRLVLSQPPILGGWRLTTVSCNRAGAVASYRGDRAHSLKGFLASLAESQCLTCQLQGSSGASLTTPLALPAARPEEPLPPIKGFAGELLHQLSTGRLQGSLDEDFLRGATSAKFTLLSKINPLGIFAQFEMAGVVIEEISLTLTTTGEITWMTKGVVYGT